MILGALLGVGGKIIDKLFPDPTKAAEAKLRLMQLEQAGELKSLEVSMSAILAEANSKDPWTSRARPSFMYVIYLMILAAIPMGILHAFNPQMANSIAVGMKEWLSAIPTALWSLFGAGYLGYTGARSFDKSKLIKAL
jgi:hypothetical protein